jgi:RHS repeat-associated protein
MTIDGAAATLTNNTTSPGTPGAGFSIGALPDGTRAFTGELDEVSVYTADISGATAAGHWAAGRRPTTDVDTGLTSRTAFDRLGRATDAWAPDLVRTKAAFDRLGNQTETIGNYRDGTASGATADDDAKATFAYDVLGELTDYCPAVQVQSAGGCDPADTGEAQAWHYGFDAMGRQTKTIAPDNATVTDLTTNETVYEAGGRVAKTCTYPAGTSCGSTNSRHVDVTYDDLGRVLTEKIWDRAGGSDTLKFTKTREWNPDGTQKSVAEANPTTETDKLSYVYDAAARLKELKDGSTVLTAYTYTASTNLVATRTDGTQGATAFDYDWARRNTSVDPPDTFVAGVVSRTYRLDGLLASQAFPSSITETLAYDAAKRPTGINLGTPGTITQAFDRAGRIVADGRSLTVSGGSADVVANTQAFSYDGLSRLTGSTGLAGDRAYTYDLDGNRLTKAVEGAATVTYTYDATDQLAKQTIGGVDAVTAFDRYGNLLQAADAANAVTTYAFDESSRLTTIDPPAGSTITFTTDALGRHAERLVGGVTADTYAYVGASETAWQTGTGTTTDALLDAEGSRLAITTGGTVKWLVFDLHGSVVALVNAGASSLSDAYRFDGWGEQIASAGAAVNPWRYRGLLNVGADAGSGALLDMTARHYTPGLGVFTQEDSVQGSAANPLSMNRYLYAHANPATLIDPDGHMAMTATGGGGCGARGCQADRAVKQLSRNRGNTKATASSAERDRSRDCGFLGGRCSDSDIFKNVTGIIAGAWDGTVGGALQLGNHIISNVDKIGPGFDAFVNDPGGSIDKIAHASGFDDPLGNLGRGWDAMLQMEPYDRAHFWSATVSGAAGTKLIPKIVPRGSANAAPAMTASGARFIATADGLIQDLGPRPGPYPLVVIGEDMAARVQPAAARMTGEWYKPPTLANRAQEIAYDRYWMREMMSQERIVVDKGPSPQRPMYPGATSDFYAAELREMSAKNYQWYYPCWSC